MQGLQTIEGVLQRSPTLVVINLLGHTLAISALCVVAIRYPWTLAVLPLCLVNAWVLHRRFMLRSSRAWLRFRWAFDNRFHWIDGAGRQGQAECVVARVWGAGWVQLTLRDADRWRYYFLVLPGDCLSAETHRRLRVRCRIRPPQIVPSDTDPA